MLANALGSSSMESILSGKGIIRGGDGVIRTVIRIRQDF